MRHSKNATLHSNTGFGEFGQEIEEKKVTGEAIVDIKGTAYAAVLFLSRKLKPELDT